MTGGVIPRLRRFAARAFVAAWAAEDMLKFFRAGVSPVPLETTLEIFGFMAAADENKRHVGAAVSLVDVLKARNAQR